MRNRSIALAAGLALALALLAWWAAGGGGSRSAAQSRAGERAPVEVPAAPAELVGDAPQAEAEAEVTAERRVAAAAPAGGALALGHLWLEGRVVGVHPDDYAELALRLEFQDRPPVPRLAAAGAGSLQLMRMVPVLAETQVGTLPSPEAAFGSPALDGEGRWRIDLVPWLAAREGPTPRVITVSASHELYFDGTSRLEVEPRALVPPPAGSERTLRMDDLRLEPAAILRGTIARPEREERAPEAELTIAGKQDTAHASLFHALQVFERGVGEARTVQLHGQLALEGRAGVLTTDGESFTFRLVLASGIELALFPLREGAPDPEPTASVQAGTDGRFELKLREGGVYLLAAVAGDARPLSRTVDLALREITELEPQRLEHGARLSGLVQGLGVVPEASLEVRALRADAAQLRALAWKSGRLGAIGERVEWLERRAAVGADGRFDLGGLAPGELHCVEALPRGQALVDPASLAERAGARGCGASLSTLAPANGLELLFPASLLVVRPSFEGAPLAEAAERLGPTEEDAPPPTFTLTIDCPELGRSHRVGEVEQDERLLLVLEPGREYHLELSGPGCEPATATVVAPPAGQATELALDLAR